MKIKHVRLDPQQHVRLREISFKKEQPIQALVREALEHYLNEQRLKASR